MSAFSRLNRIFQANINALLDRAEDPERIIDSTLEEMTDAVRAAKRDQVTALGTAKRLDSEVADAAGEVAKWNERAALAVREGDDDLARDALRQRSTASRAHGAKQAEALAAKRAVTQLEDVIVETEARASDLAARKTTLASQVRAARAAATPASAPTPELSGLTARIDAMEAEVEVAQTLESPERARVDARFAELERDQREQTVEDELADLKRKLGGDL